MEIYILDTETTGLDGHPDDVIVEIAICKVDTNQKTVTKIYDSIVGHDVKSWDSDRKHAWIFDNSTLDLSMVASAKTEETIVTEVRSILKNKYVTCYNVSYDFTKFLYHEPWKLREVVKEVCSCIMESATSVCKIEGIYGDYKWPKLDEAYSILCDNPAKIEDQTHRAMDDTLMASHVLLALIDKDAYLFPEES